MIVGNISYVNHSGIIRIEESGYYEVIFGLTVKGEAESIALKLNSTVIPGSIVSATSTTDQPTMAIIIAIDAAQLPAELSVINNGSQSIELSSTEGSVSAFITVKRILSL